MRTTKGLAPELFRDQPLLAYLAPVHVPVSSATIQAPLEFLGPTRRQSDRALPYRHKAHRPLPERATPSHRLLTRDFGIVPVNSSLTESLSFAAHPGAGTSR